jgi:DNA-directed RNA polymerase subunit M/transcription elongation factor TFIIS
MAHQVKNIDELQKMINNDLLQRINMDQFKSKKSYTMKMKNTDQITCKKCKSDNIFERSVQMRSADEATSKIYECLNCGNTWIIN